MYFNLAFAVTFAFITITWPAKTQSARNFNKFWNQSLVFIKGSPIISMTMPLRSECVTLCGLQPNCCCTQWVPSNNTCTILVSDRVALSPNSLALSTIDKDFMYCDAHPEAAVNESIPPGGPQFFSRRLGSVVPLIVNDPICINYTATCANGGVWQSNCTKGSQLFISNGTFYPPPGVTLVRVFVIGGGGGGTCGNYPGGSGGYVSCGSVNVSGMTTVTVGNGGTPSGNSNNVFVGGSSSFGSHITAMGGKTPSYFNGVDGGTGSGYATVVQI